MIDCLFEESSCLSKTTETKENGIKTARLFVVVQKIQIMVNKIFNSFVKNITFQFYRHFAFYPFCCSTAKCLVLTVFQEPLAQKLFEKLSRNFELLPVNSYFEFQLK